MTTAPECTKGGMSGSQLAQFQTRAIPLLQAVTSWSPLALKSTHSILVGCSNGPATITLLRQSQNRTWPADTVKTRLPSGLNLARYSPVSCGNDANGVNVRGSKTRAVPSKDVASSDSPSALKSTVVIAAPNRAARPAKRRG